MGVGTIQGENSDPLFPAKQTQPCDLSLNAEIHHLPPLHLQQSLSPKEIEAEISLAAQ